MKRKLRIIESETRTLNALIRAVQDRIEELEEDSVDECLQEDLGGLEDFQGYEFDPNSSWTNIWSAVIEPIIDDHYNHIGFNYTQEEAEDAIDNIINIFYDEYKNYPNVVKACERFFDSY